MDTYEYNTIYDFRSWSKYRVNIEKTKKNYIQNKHIYSGSKYDIVALLYEMQIFYIINANFQHN